MQFCSEVTRRVLFDEPNLYMVSFIERGSFEKFQTLNGTTNKSG